MDSTGTKDTKKRKSRNMSEKKRRDQFNTLVNDLCSLVSKNKKMDKTTVLKTAIEVIKSNKEMNDKMKSYEIKEDWKPPFMTNNEFVTLMLEAIDGFLMVTTKKGTILYSSESVTPLLGFLPESLNKRTLLDIIHSSDRSRVFNIMNSSKYIPTDSDTPDFKNTENQVYIQCHMKCEVLDGSTSPVYEQVVIEGSFRKWANGFDDDTCDVCMCCTVTLQQAQMIRELPSNDTSKKEFTSRHSLEWKFLFLDHRGPPVIGYLPFEVLGTSGYDYIHPDDLERLAACHEHLMQSGERKSCYYRFLTKGQQWIWLQSTSFISYHQWNSKPEFVVCKNKVISYAEVKAHQAKSRSKEEEFPLKKPLSPVPKEMRTDQVSTSSTWMDNQPENLQPPDTNTASIKSDTAQRKDMPAISMKTLETLKSEIVKNLVSAQKHPIIKGKKSQDHQTLQNRVFKHPGDYVELEHFDHHESDEQKPSNNQDGRKTLESPATMSQLPQVPLDQRLPQSPSDQRLHQGSSDQQQPQPPSNQRLPQATSDQLMPQTTSEQHLPQATSEQHLPQATAEQHLSQTSNQHNVSMISMQSPQLGGGNQSSVVNSTSQMIIPSQQPIMFNPIQQQLHLQLLEKHQQLQAAIIRQQQELQKISNQLLLASGIANNPAVTALLQSQNVINEQLETVQLPPMGVPYLHTQPYASNPVQQQPQVSAHDPSMIIQCSTINPTPIKSHQQPSPSAFQVHSNPNTPGGIHSNPNTPGGSDGGQCNNTPLHKIQLQHPVSLHQSPSKSSPMHHSSSLPSLHPHSPISIPVHRSPYNSNVIFVQSPSPFSNKGGPSSQQDSTHSAGHSPAGSLQRSFPSTPQEALQIMQQSPYNNAPSSSHNNSSSTVATVTALHPSYASHITNQHQSCAPSPAASMTMSNTSPMGLSQTSQSPIDLMALNQDPMINSVGGQGFDLLQFAPGNQQEPSDFKMFEAL